MARIKFELTFDTDNGSFSVVNTETGEVQEVAIPKKKATTKKSKDDGSTVPTITVEENKLVLNSAAAKLLVDENADENRVEINMEKQGKLQVPVLVTGKGNKITKSNTVACRGAAHNEIIKYGTEFVLEAHPKNKGWFVLKGNVESVPEPEGDENFSIPEEDDELNLDSLLEESTEIDGLDLDL